MATQELRNRTNWQTISGAKAQKAEELFKISLETALNSVYPGKFKIERHPKDFSSIYSDYPLNEEVLSKIYNVDMKKNGKPKYHWGIKMDFAIRNLENKKNLIWGNKTTRWLDRNYRYASGARECSREKL